MYQKLFLFIIFTSNISLQASNWLNQQAQTIIDNLLQNPSIRLYVQQNPDQAHLLLQTKQEDPILNLSTFPARTTVRIGNRTFTKDNDSLDNHWQRIDDNKSKHPCIVTTSSMINYTRKRQREENHSTIADLLKEKRK